MQNEHQIFAKITEITRHQNYRDGEKLSCSRMLTDGEFQLTDPWSAKILVEKAQKCNTLFPRTSGKNFLKNLYKKFVKILADLQLSLRSSGTIFTDPHQGKKANRSVQILKESSTWVLNEHFQSLWKSPKTRFHNILCCRKLNSDWRKFSTPINHANNLIKSKQLIPRNIYIYSQTFFRYRNCQKYCYATVTGNIFSVVFLLLPTYI